MASNEAFLLGSSDFERLMETVIAQFISQKFSLHLIPTKIWDVIVRAETEQKYSIGYVPFIGCWHYNSTVKSTS